jgi:TolB-like protein
MLSGKSPFYGSGAELMDQHQRAAPPFDKLRLIPAPIMALLEVLLAKDPNRRFQTPAQLQQALTKVREAIASGARLTAEKLKSAGDQSMEKVAKIKPRRKTVRRLLSAGLCLAIVIAAWFFYTDYSKLLNQGAAAAAPAEKSIAVLPFENISPNKDDAYFAAGVQDEILNNLAKIAQLKVISRTSVMQYRREAKRDLRQIADALGVANVLEGTVRRDGNHVRVSTELVNAQNDNTIWADSYDRDLTDIFAIQSEIAQKVASKLSAQLSPKEKEKIEGKPTDSLEAYDLYLQANELFADVNLLYMKDPRPDLLKAIEYLQEAIRGDSKFALAYCLLANAHDSLYNGNFDNTTVDFDRTPERRALGDAAIAEALRLRPDLAEVSPVPFLSFDDARRCALGCPVRRSL